MFKKNIIVYFLLTILRRRSSSSSSSNRYGSPNTAAYPSSAGIIEEQIGIPKSQYRPSNTYV